MNQTKTIEARVSGAFAPGSATIQIFSSVPRQAPMIVMEGELEPVPQRVGTPVVGTQLAFAAQVIKRLIKSS